MPTQLRLTKSRSEWAAQRSAKTTFKGTRLMPPVSVAVRYAGTLSGLVEQMVTETNREVRSLFKSDAAAAHFGQDADMGAQARILTNALQQKFAALFARAAKPTAETMVDGAAKASGTALHSSLQQLSGGLSMKTHFDTGPLQSVFRASVAENVSLIKSIASQYMQKVTGAVMRSITTGNGLQDLVPAMQKLQGDTHRRAELIALDQTRKTFNSVNRGRMQAVGVKKFEWLHSGGGAHPREDHVAMDGNIYSFDKLPVIDPRTGERGIPGQAPNCRCTMSPVFDFTDDESTETGADHAAVHLAERRTDGGGGRRDSQ